jgi:hypothetical protein
MACPPTIKDTKLLAMWGPLAYPPVDKTGVVATIAEATYRYIHGEITDPRRYQALMNLIMDRCDEKTKLCGATHEMKMQTYKEVVNFRYFGKTAIESFVATEIAVRIARGKNPSVGFRKILRRTFLGLMALHQTVGPWVDSSNDMIYMYGMSDTNANIASSCGFFPSCYTTSVSMDGGYTIGTAAVREYAPRNPDEPLTGSVLFDFIKILFPSTSTIPFCDTQWLAHKFFALQTRAQAMYHQSVLLGAETAPIDITYNASFFDFVETIMYLGTNMEKNASETDKALIKATDVFMTRFLQSNMNHALRMSSYRM